MMIDCIFIPVVLIRLYPFCFIIPGWTGLWSLVGYFKSVIFRTQSLPVAGGRIGYTITGARRRSLSHLIQTGS